MHDLTFLNKASDWFIVHDHDDYVELEARTARGVNMIVTLHKEVESSLLDQFMEYVCDFNVDEQVDLHRQGEVYRTHFTVRQSLADFEAFQEWLSDKAYSLTCNKSKL